ncbi:hypothetical protein, partial [Vibrio cholerae]
LPSVMNHFHVVSPVLRHTFLRHLAAVSSPQQRTGLPNCEPITTNSAISNSPSTKQCVNNYIDKSKSHNNQAVQLDGLIVMV